MNTRLLISNSLTGNQQAEEFIGIPSEIIMDMVNGWWDKSEGVTSGTWHENTKVVKWLGCFVTYIIEIF